MLSVARHHGVGRFTRESYSVVMLRGKLDNIAVFAFSGHKNAYVLVINELIIYDPRTVNKATVRSGRLHPCLYTILSPVPASLNYPFFPEY